MRAASVLLISFLLLAPLGRAADPPVLVLAKIAAENQVYASAGAFLSAAKLAYQWDPAAARLTFQAGDHNVALTPSTALVSVDDAVIRLPVPPRFLGGVLVLPAAFFAKVARDRLGIVVELKDLPPASPRPTKREPRALRVLVIDPGHGGKDHGAASSTGVMEKDVVLAVAKSLVELLGKETGIRVVLTRDRDVFVPLSERARIANQANADAFLSIHANAHRNKGSTGIETYYLAFDPSDEGARTIALAENKAIGYEEMGATYGGKFDDLKMILWDLVKTENLQESAGLAENVQDSLCRSMGAHSRGVKQAPFFVLMGTEMPAVLAEIGFLSNPKDAAFLTNSGTQGRIVRALADAVLRYDEVLARKKGVANPVRSGDGTAPQAGGR